MWKRRLLAVPVAAALAALLAACGTSNGPELQFDATAYDAAAEIQPSDAVPDTNPVRQDAAYQPEADRAIAAKVAAAAYIYDFARDDGYPSHDRIVKVANSAALSSSRPTTHPMERGWSPEPSLESVSAVAAADANNVGNAVVAAAAGQATDSFGDPAVEASVQLAPDIPKAALQDASFTLVTVETDQGEQVILMPSEDYVKVCPHRLRMGDEFSDIAFGEF